MGTDSGGGGGGGAKRQRVDELGEAVASDAVPVDRISALPDELRLRVLTQLPLRDAIRTGALARGWRGLWRGRWAHRTSLEVRVRSRNDIQRELDTLSREPRPRRRLELFSLTVEITSLKTWELRRFLDCTAERGVEDLHVRSRTGTLVFHFPLSCPALARLWLHCVAVSSLHYKGARPFLALVVIRLVEVSFARKAFREMMALCPNLLTLELHSCRCRGHGWEFDRLPPNLRSLAIDNCSEIASLDVVRVPTLRSFSYSGRFSNLPLSIPRDAALSDLCLVLHHTSSMKQWNIHTLRKSLPKDLSSLRILTICNNALAGASVLPADGASAQLLPNFILHSLKELYLLMFNMESINLSKLYLFLEAFQFPNLERLLVQFPSDRYYCKRMVSVKLLEEPPAEDVLDNLVMVKVMNFHWWPTEVQLLSFLLRKARSLRKLVIVSPNVTPKDSPATPEADLSLLKEALVNGKIMFIDSAETQLYPSSSSRYSSCQSPVESEPN